MIISVGFQNQGLAPLLSASQAFAQSPTACNVQVSNTRTANVAWSAYAVVDTGTGGNVTAVNTAVTTATI